MGSLFSMFSKPKQGAIFNHEGNYFLGTLSDPRHPNYDSFGGNNRTKKNDNKYRISKKKSFKRKK